MFHRPSIPDNNYCQSQTSTHEPGPKGGGGRVLLSDPFICSQSGQCTQQKARIDARSTHLVSCDWVLWCVWVRSCACVAGQPLFSILSLGCQHPSADAAADNHVLTTTCGGTAKVQQMLVWCFFWLKTFSD